MFNKCNCQSWCANSSCQIFIWNIWLRHGFQLSIKSDSLVSPRSLAPVPCNSCSCRRKSSSSCHSERSSSQRASRPTQRDTRKHFKILKNMSGARLYMCHVSSFQSRSSWISSSVISFASSENSMNASRNSAICSSVLGQANISKSHQALNPFATLLWSMSRPQTLLNTLSPVQLIRHAPITKASSNYTGMSMWMPFLWHLSHQWVCSKSGGTCATLQVMLSTGNPCLCFRCRPAPPPPKFLFTSAFYQQIHSKSLLPFSTSWTWANRSIWIQTEKSFQQQTINTYYPLIWTQK